MCYCKHFQRKQTFMPSHILRQDLVASAKQFCIAILSFGRDKINETQTKTHRSGSRQSSHIFCSVFFIQTSVF